MHATNHCVVPSDSCRLAASMTISTSNFDLHCLRTGGVTAAANANVPDRLFKRHGRWRSEVTKDGHVKDHNNYKEQA